jgi:hypothetical protein
VGPFFLKKKILWRPEAAPDTGERAGFKKVLWALVQTPPPQNTENMDPSTSTIEAVNVPKLQSKSIVRLNIGGTKFQTTSSTLLNCGSSYFSSMLSGNFTAMIDDKGYFFIDRDGKYFEPILEYLRTGELNIPPHLSREVRASQGCTVLHSIRFSRFYASFTTTWRSRSFSILLAFGGVSHTQTIYESPSLPLISIIRLCYGKLTTTQ